MATARMFGVAALLYCACIAAASSAIADDDAIKLGPITGYSNEAEAAHNCSDAGVVWADHKTGFLYPRFMEQYGKTPDGTYACYDQAKKADYWGFGTVDTMGMKGKTFPLIVCPTCF